MSLYVLGPLMSPSIAPTVGGDLIDTKDDGLFSGPVPYY